MDVPLSHLTTGLMMVLVLVTVCLMRKRKHLASLEGKHVVITGGSSGIGLALAKECLSQGAFVTLIARNELRLSHAAHILSSSIPPPTTPASASSPHGRILLKAVDVSDAASVSAAIVECFDRKPIDILICNAGTTVPGLFGDVKISDLDTVTKTNLMGCVYPIHAALPLMKARSKYHPSSIVFMSSLSGLLFVSGVNMYTTTKYGLKGLAELLRFELMPHNIKVSLVCPGFTETPMLDEADRAAALTSKLMNKLQFYDRAHAESADAVAARTMEGVKRGTFLITTSISGFILGVLGRGFVPSDSFAEALIELLLLVPVRLSSFVWLAYAKRVMRSTQQQDQLHKAA